VRIRRLLRWRRGAVGALKRAIQFRGGGAPLNGETSPLVAIAPADSPSWMRGAVERGGGRVVPVAEASALIWGLPSRASDLSELLAGEGSHLGWVQLPFAGVEPFADLISSGRIFTAGQGVYAEPVAEHALALALAGMRHIGSYARRQSWKSDEVGFNLIGANVVIFGAGGICTTLIRLLQPFRTSITVVRRTATPMAGADRVVSLDERRNVLADADVVFLALALTPETVGCIAAPELALLPSHAWVVNVARGAHIVTDDLVQALQDGGIGGAALDVTDPEPLPDGHPLWQLDSCIITPHTANTPQMAVPLLGNRITQNVERWIKGNQLLGIVDPSLGY